MDRMNYHHLRYFHEVATVGNLTQAASRLNVSQSALSTQIRQLEERLGHPLFERVGRRLVLTEAGGIALDHASRIFQAGDELVAALEQRDGAVRPLRLGAQSTLSRNFQLRFLRLTSPRRDRPDPVLRQQRGAAGGPAGPGAGYRADNPGPAAWTGSPISWPIGSPDSRSACTPCPDGCSMPA